MTSKFSAQTLAQSWLESWNSHDLDAIMSHYADEIELTSPFVTEIVGEPSGTLKGKSALREYFAKGLAAYPDLHFELRQIFPGVDSVVLYYRSVKNMLAAEVMILNSHHQVVKVLAHYCPAPVE